MYFSLTSVLDHIKYIGLIKSYVNKGDASMKHLKPVITGLICLVILTAAYAKSQSSPVEENTKSEPSKLVVLWTSGDKDVAIKMVFMYTTAAKTNKWWDTIRFIVWGPSSKLLSEDEEVQKGIQKMKEAGVELFACKACADLYGVSDKLAELGLDVKYMGQPLTSMLKSGWVSLTF